MTDVQEGVVINTLDQSNKQLIRRLALLRYIDSPKQQEANYRHYGIES